MKTVHGVGVNDADYSVAKTHCKIYRCWAAMIGRCYSSATQGRQPRYVGCSVVPEWLLFSNFASWYKKNEHHGKFLDKDLKVHGNKVYGPSYCLMVSREVNNLLTAREACRGDLPIGVSRHPGTPKYLTYLRIAGVKELIGCYTTVDEAAEAYRKAKAARVTVVATQQKCAETRIALLNAAAKIAAGSYFEV